MEKSTITNLLTQIGAIRSQYEKIAEITGENFNIFNVLKLSTNEVRTHSAFIAELLNPAGSHGQKDVFLNLFIDLLKFKFTKNENIRLKALNNINVSQALVIVEESKGAKQDDYGGRIDIVVKDNFYQIVIENKIYAQDQEKQLIRYNNEYPESTLLYLTLDGKDADEISVKSKIGVSLKSNLDYFTISYEAEIVKWLESCKKEAVNLPLLRETISQYIQLIKQLTHQTMEEAEKSEIINKVLQSEEQILALKVLTENNIWDETRKRILTDIINVETGIGNDLGLITEKDQDYSLGNKNSGFWFFKEKWYYCIYFCFEDDFEKLSFGIYAINNNTNHKSEVKNKFAEILGKSIDDSQWVWKQNFDAYEDISWFALSKDKGRELFRNKITDIINTVGHLM